MLASENDFMALGKKTGGRTKGTPNRATRELAERLTELGCDPVEGMARLAMDPRMPPELRGRMFAELAQYLHPKRRAVEVRDQSGPKVIFQIDSEPLPPCPV
jgi:hypothetical protein